MTKRAYRPTAYDRVIAALEKAGCEPDRSGKKWQCPAHDDRTPSLSVADTGDKVLLHCFADCDTGAVLKALGLTWSDLGEGGSNGGGRPLGEPVDTYNYLDERGRTALFRVVRYEPKTFRQEHRNEDGTWVPGLGSVHPVVYQLPYVIRGVERGETIYVTEGEKDADYLRKKLHLVATTNPGGVGMGWRDEYNETFRGAKVILVADNDNPDKHQGKNPGVDHMLKVAGELNGVASSVEVFMPPRVGHDISDHLDAGLGLNDLVPVEEPAWDETIDDDGDEHRTDLGNATRLVEADGRDLRYCIARKAWYVWDGRRWVADETGEVQRRAKSVVRSMFDEALDEPDHDRRTRMITWALASESASRIEAMVKLAQTEPGIPVRVEDLDADPWILNVENGTLDLKTMQLRQHRREDLCTRIAAAPYEPSAKDPKWTRFLHDVLPNLGVRRYVQKAAGYSASGDDAEGNVFLVHGPTHTGKTTVLEGVKAALGTYAMSMDIETIAKGRREGGRARSDLVRLFGARFVSSTESPEYVQLDEARVKQLTGGDTLVARTLYAEEQEARPSWTIWIGSNYRPRVNNADDAIWKRLLELPFTRQHAKTDKTIRPHFLRSKKARTAILAWLIEGLQAYVSDGLEPPQEVIKVTEEYRQQMNPLYEWVQDCCALDGKQWSPFHVLRQSYEGFAGAHALGNNRFARALEQLPGVERRRRVEVPRCSGGT